MIVWPCLGGNAALAEARRLFGQSHRTGWGAGGGAGAGLTGCSQAVGLKLTSTRKKTSSGNPTAGQEDAGDDDDQEADVDL